MKQSIKRLAILSVALMAASAKAATQAQIDAAWNKGVAWLMTNQHGDGGWSSTLIDGISSQQGLGFQATAAAVEALANVNIKSGYTYMGGVAWLSNAEPASVDALSRQAIALSAAGIDVTGLGTKLFAWRNVRLTWGAYADYETSIVDTAKGLHGMLSVNSGYPDAGSAGCTLLGSQHNAAPDTGWSHTTLVTGIPAGHSGSNILATTSAALALNKWVGSAISVTCTGTTTVTYQFSTVFSTAVSWLLTKKNAIDNGFSDVAGTSTVLETALVLRALKTVAPANVNAPTAIDYLVAQQAADGSWRGDALQTAETLLALAWPTTATVQRPSATVATDTDGDGIPDGVETILGKNPAVADSRFLADGAGSIVTQAAQLRAIAAVVASPTAASLISLDGSTTQPTTKTVTWQKQVDLEIDLVGSSLQLPSFEVVAKSLFAPGSAEVLLDDGGHAGAQQGNRYRAYYGVVSGSGVAGLDGKRLLIHLTTDGGSFAGVAQIARGETHQRMQISAACTGNGQDHRWSCPLTTVNAVADAGLADLSPAQHVVGNLPAGASPLSPAELGRLDANRTHAMVLAPAISRSLQHAGLTGVSKAQLAKILTGGAQTSASDILASLPAKPIRVCRLADGAQAAINTLILGTGCDPNAAKPTAASATVINAPNAGGVMDCLDDADRNGAFAIAVLSTEHQADAHWGYGSLDGVTPSMDAVQMGRYRYFTEGWMQWRKHPVKGALAASGNTLEALKVLRSRLGDPAILNAATGVLALAQSPTSPDRMQVTTRGNACVQPR